MEHSINIDWANKMIGMDINEENKKVQQKEDFYQHNQTVWKKD